MPEIEIIDKPKLKTFLRNIAEVSFTTIMWGLWIYLFLPLVNIILWLLGIHVFYIEVIERAGYLEFLGIWGKLGWSILAIFLILRLWGYYNYWRFKKKDRRRGFPYNTAEGLAEYFKMPAEKIAALQSSREVVWPIQHHSEPDIANQIVGDKSNSQIYHEEDKEHKDIKE